MSALDLIKKFARLITVTRTAAGDYVNGIYVPGLTSTFSEMMSMQPLNGKERLDLTEGQRTRNHQKVYSPVELFTSEQSPSTLADVLSLDGKNYEVMRVEYWNSSHNQIDPFWKVVVAEKNP